MGFMVGGPASERPEVSLILVDGSALQYRAYYAFANRPLQAATGEHTSVVFGFCNSLLRLIEARRPSHMAVVFDVREPTFRHRMFAGYKATRKPMPEDLALQLPRLREVLAAWALPVLEVPGYEADDVMATLARRSARVCERAWFYTGDKDFLQVLDERVGMLKPGRRGDEVTEVTAQDIKREYGMEPALLVDVFALCGDASDNIPGAPGIGTKTAVKLINDFGSLERLYEAVAEPEPRPPLTSRLRRVLQENHDQVMLSRRLFRIDTDVDVPVDWPSLRTRLPTGERIEALFRQLELRRLGGLAAKLARQLGETPDPERTLPAQATAEIAVAATPGHGGEARGETAVSADQESDTGGSRERDEMERRGYRLAATEQELQAFLSGLVDGEPLAVDTETDDLRTDTARLVGLSLAAAGKGAVYVPVLLRSEAANTEPDGGPGSAASDLFGSPGLHSNLEWVQRTLAPVLADPHRLKIGQNLKFDEWILSRHGMEVVGPRFDTMVAAYVLDPGRQAYSLDELAAVYLDERTMRYAELFAPGDRRRDILEVPLSRLALYAAEDADVACRLHGGLDGRLREAEMHGLFTDIEMPLLEVLFRMERHGVKVDTEFLAGLAERFTAELARLAERIQETAGEPFNVQSPRQLASILFEKLGLKPLKKTATGYSTDVSVLEALAERHPLPGLVLEHRQLAKLLNTYVEALPRLVNPQTGLIHTCFNQAVAATGRLSSSDPNLQNIPIRTEAGRSIRRAFVPRRPGNVIMSADYSQVELRLLAHLSQDSALTAAFREGGDVHRRTAALIAGVDEQQVTSAMRSRAKTINFGVIYGMGSRALARQIGVTTREAQEFIDSYFATYPGVRRFIDETKDRARREGSVSTLLGRRRLLPEILSDNNRVRSFQERIAVNTPIQGTAADVIKLAMIQIDRALRERQAASMLLLQVHDELLLEVEEQELTMVTELVRDHMENVLPLRVPLEVDIHVGNNWAEAHD
jgi:DNA polymerase-1